MTNKTMPERITVRHNLRTGGLSIAEEKIGILLPEDILEAEYVQADLATGDANEPLQDGQYRWIMVRDSDFWQPALANHFDTTVVGGPEGYEFYLIAEDDCQVDYEDVLKFGPVIRPPEDK